MKRLMYGLAAVFVAVATALVPAQPASAAPAQCTVEEWTDPARWADCTNRAKEGIGEALGCIGAPTPGSPTSGLPGFFTNRPESSLGSGVTGQYSTYGVGGYGLDTYNMGCLGTVQHPDLVFWNNAAETEFLLAAFIIGAANGLREIAYDPGSMWGWSDAFIKTSTEAIYQYVFSKFGVLTIAVIGVFLMWRARHGQMSETMKIAGWAIAVMVVAIAVVRWPVQAAHGADAVGSGGIALAHQVVGQGPQHIPADECVLGPEACTDHRSPAVRASDTVTEAVLYRAWLRAVLGSADSPTAVKYGPILYDATTLNWAEAARIAENPNLRQGLLDQKANQWNTVAEQIRIEDGEAYEHLQGVHGSSRFGAGLVAVLSALAYSLFDIAASIVILAGFLVLRIAVILFPLLATLGVFYYASSPMMRVINASVAAIFNIVLFGFGSAAYTATTALVFGNSQPGYVQVFIVALAGGAAWLVLHPVRHLVYTATGRSRREESWSSRWINFAKETHAARSAQPAASADPAAEPGDAAAGVSAPRPESAPAAPPKSTSRRLLDAAAPTVATALGHPEVAAAMGLVNKARNRPEAGTDAQAPAAKPSARQDLADKVETARDMAAVGRPEARS